MDAVKLAQIEELAKILEESSDNWVGSNSDVSLESVQLVLMKRKEYPTDVKIAAYFLYNYGPCLSGETTDTWLRDANLVLQIAKL